MAKKKSSASRTVPSALQQAVASLGKRIDGRYVYGLPAYELNAKLKVELVELGDLGPFEDNEINAEDNPGWLPFGVFRDQPQFLVIATEAPYPVAIWDHETGTFHPVWDSLDEMAARVIDKKDKTPFELLEGQLEAIGELIDGDAHGEALARIEPVLLRLPKLPPGRGFEDDGLARAHNLHGLALKGVGRRAEARAAFDRAAQAGERHAELNILSLLDEDRAASEVIARAVEARKGNRLDDHGRVWTTRYLAFAYLDIGDAANAEAALREIVDRYAISDAKKVSEAREGLEAYIAAGRPGADTARGFLAWCKPKTYEVSAEDAARNRAWWTQLPAGMRGRLLEKVKLGKTMSPSDADIARCQDVTSLTLQAGDGTFDDAMLPLFLPLSNVESLGFHGEPDSIAVLKQLPRLQKLMINNTVVKGFVWPSRADRALWKAAETADRAGIEAALAAGASLSSRAKRGKTALALVAERRDLALCQLLIARGADPWAGNHLGGSEGIFGGFTREDRTVLEQAAAAAGIPHPDRDLYRKLSWQSMPSAASFKPVGKLDPAVSRGAPQLDSWPAGVRVQMQSPRSDDKLYDVLPFEHDIPLVSERVAEALRGEPNLELLPVVLVDHAGKPRPETYYLLNPLAKDCLVIEQCYPAWNLIATDKIMHLAAFVFDPARIAGARIFRVARMSSSPVIVSRELAEQLKPFSGVAIEYLGR